jgi:condensin complex subunit 2
MPESTQYDHDVVNTQYTAVDFASQMVNEPRRTKFEQINYAKTAKRVDVKRLKDNIWHQLAPEVCNLLGNARC